MKQLTLLLTLVLTLVGTIARAQDDLSGTWSGALQVDPATTLELHFIFTRGDDGSYSAVLTSPNPAAAVQDTPADSTSFEAGRLELTVDALAGRYEGTLANGTISGTWIQPGAEIPLELVPYVERVMSDEAKAAIRGSWVGELSVQQLTLAIVFRFEDNDEGEFVGYLDSPDQGASGIPVSNIRFEDGELSFDIPQAQGGYTATVSGDAMDGTFTQLAQGNPLVMQRGEFQARGLDLPQATRDRLEGSWVGRVNNAAGGALAIVFRFETSADGAFTAYLDSPEQGASGIPMSDIVLNGDTLTLEVPAAQASFSASLSADAMEGTWAQRNMSQPVTMERGEYVPTVQSLDLADEAMEQLLGTWRGEMGPLEIIFRFETGEAGAKLAFLDVPAQGANGLAVPEATLEGDQLTLRIPNIGTALSGTLEGDTLTATWAQGQASNPLTLMRDP